MESLLAHINSYFPLSAEVKNALPHFFNEEILPKEKFLVRKGQVCTQLYFLEQGAIRGFYNAESKEITHWFAFENNFVTSFYSFTTGKPAVENIQLLEGSVLWRIAKKDMVALCNQYHEVEKLVRIAYESYYVKLEERFVNSHFKTATELYENVLRESPHIIERIPLGYIASYLGMSSETLSRVRSRL